MKTTAYFDSMRARPDRALIKDEWIVQAVQNPVREAVQADGRFRRWARIDDAEGRYLRVVVLSDGKTIHNAFFDRRYEP
jgi:hypothetical protein